MLTVTELKQLLGFYDVPHNLMKVTDIDNDASTIQTNGHKNKNNEYCMVCTEEFKEEELVAVNDGCKVPHSLHIACFLEYCCGSYETPNKSSGPNTLHKMHNCMICNLNGTWREWKFSTTSQRAWKKGNILPDKKKIFAVHEYKEREGENHFANFIICKNLLYAVKYKIGNSSLRMNRPGNLSNPDLDRLYRKYDMATKKKFKCKFCLRQVSQLKKSRLKNVIIRVSIEFVVIVLLSEIRLKIRRKTKKELMGS